MYGGMTGVSPTPTRNSARDAPETVSLTSTLFCWGLTERGLRFDRWKNRLWDPLPLELDLWRTVQLERRRGVYHVVGYEGDQDV